MHLTIVLGAAATAVADTDWSISHAAEALGSAARASASRPSLLRTGVGCELLVRSLENTIIHHADYAFWGIARAGGLLKPESIAELKVRH